MEEWYYKRDSFKRRNPVTRISMARKRSKSNFVVQINQTVKIQLQGIDKQEIALKAGEPVTVVF